MRGSEEISSANERSNVDRDDKDEASDNGHEVPDGVSVHDRVKIHYSAQKYLLVPVLLLPKERPNTFSVSLPLPRNPIISLKTT